MQTTEGNPPHDQVDRVSALLEEVLETEVLGQGDLLERLCTRFPECALALRMGYASLQQMDLLQVGAATPAAEAPAPLAAGLPRSLGPFRLLEFLGGGGMGTVYRAEDLELKRDVALKLVRGELLASVRTRTRFQRESEALARLDHPGLCTVYRAGTTDGQPWIAMRLVRGTTLAEQIEARRKHGSDGAGKRSSGQSREELQRLLLLFEKVARALASAHAAGVVHRDLKPGNLVLTGDDEPVVIDFGLVHLDDSGPHLTASGDHIGTPAYMAPEQVEAKGREPGPATDVYALGVTLFEALTLESPYPTRNREELFHGIVRGDRRRLRQVSRTLPADLEVVLEKALDVEPARRYGSMSEFAEDLRRVRQHEPPAARRIGAALRLRRWCQRSPVAATFLSLLGVGLGVAVVLEARRHAAWNHSVAMNYGLLAAQLVDENPEHALDVAMVGVDREPEDAECLGLLLRALECTQPHESWPLPWPKAPGSEIKRLVVAPDGHAALVLGDTNGKVVAPVLWRDGVVQTLPVPAGVLDADWSPDGAWFLTAGMDGPPRLWTATGEKVAEFVVPDAPANMPIPRARFVRGSDLIVFACSDGIARIHDRAKGSWTRLFPQLCRGKRMFGLAVSADGARIAVGDRDGLVVVHETDRALAELPGQELVPASDGAAQPATGGNNDLVRNFELDFGAGGELVQSFSKNPRRRSLWTWAGKPLMSWGDAQNPAPPMPPDPSRDCVLEAAQDREPRLWRLHGGELVFQHALAGHDGRVSSCAFGKDGRLLTIGVDGTARVWDAQTGRQELLLRGFHQELRACAFVGDGSHCLLVSNDAIHRFDLRSVPGPRLRVGNFRDLNARFPGTGWSGAILTADDAQRLTLHDSEGHLVKEIQEPIVRRSGVDSSTTGEWLVSTSYDRDAKTWAQIYGPDLVPAQQIPDLHMIGPVPTFGPADHLLLLDSGVTERDRSLLLVPAGRGTWQAAPDPVQQAFRQACAGAAVVAFHAPTSTLAVAKPGAAVALFHWSASPPDLQFQADLMSDQQPVRKLAFSPDGQHLLLGCVDDTARLVSRSGRIRARFTDHIGMIVDVGISSRGERLLVAATESGVMIGDFDGNLVLPIRPRAGSVTMARFLPDGEHVLFATTARSTRIVPIVPARLRTLARGLPHPEVDEGTWQSYHARVGDPR